MIKVRLMVTVAAISAIAGASVKVPEFRLVEPEKGGEAMFFGADGIARTGKFKVSEVMNETVLGQMDKADKKFIENAASAKLELKGETLEVSIDCPVPVGMTAEKVKEPWHGDRVELLIRPQLDADEVSVFAVNCGGAYSAQGFRNGVRDMGWSSASKITVTNNASGFKVHMEIPVKDAFSTKPEPGDVFGMNIQRTGRTCGRHSAWAKTGGVFNSSRWVFGTLVFGGPGEYFRRRFRGYASRCKEIAAASPVAAVEVRKVADAVKRAVEAHGDEPDAFAALDTMFKEFDQALVAISLRDYPVLIYDSGDVTGNRPDPKVGTRPMEKIVIKSPRNTLRIKAFALANLTDADYLGNLKVLADPVYFYKRQDEFDVPKPTIADAFTLRRAVWDQLKNGQPNADATVEMPFRSLVELGPGKVMPVYLELDTHNIAAGNYRLWLGLNSATQGIPDVRIPIEVTVTDDDLDAIDIPRLGYTHLGISCRYGHRPLTNCVRTLVQRGYNCILLSKFGDLYPRMNDKGEWLATDYSDIDRYIDLWMAGGLPAEKMYIHPFIGVERVENDRTGRRYRGLRDAAGNLVPFASPEYEKGMRLLIGSFTDHVRRKYGIRRERIIWYPVDEADGKLDDPEFKSSISRCRWMGRCIKSVDPNNVAMWNPEPSFLGTDECENAMSEFARYFDLIMPYRPMFSSRAIEIVRNSGTKTVATYHISGYEASIEAYRRGAWQNLRDGFAPIDAFWHLDECGYFAGKDSVYGSCIVDWDYDLIALSRRQLGADMAYHEGRLVLYLRRKFAGDRTELARIEQIVKEAADASTMSAMENALEQLLAML